MNEPVAAEPRPSEAPSDGEPSAQQSGANPTPVVDEEEGTVTGTAPAEEGRADGELEQRDDPAAVGASMRAEVIATDAKRVTTKGEAAPAAGSLWREVEEGGEEVTHTVGSLQEPSWWATGDPESVFINGGPWMEDIAQGNIGSCYLLGVLQSTVGACPARIVDMIDDAGSSVTFNFFRHDGAHWVAAPITTDKTTMVSMDADGANIENLGSEFRLASFPSRSEWYSSLGGGYLWTYQEAFFEMALWVALMEKAYATFCEQHGQYGGYAESAANDQEDEDGNAKSGVEIMEGGFEDLLMGVLFGDDVVADEHRMRANTDEDSIPAKNAEIIRSLLMVNGEGMDDGEVMLMQVGMDLYYTFKRLLVLIPELEAHAEQRVEDIKDEATSLFGIITAPMETYEAYQEGSLHLWTGLDDLTKKCEEYIASRDAGTAAEVHDLIRDEVAAIAAGLVDPGKVPILHEEDAPTSFVQFLELGVQAATGGDDQTDGQRFVLANHSYSVLSSILRGFDGQDLGLAPGDVDARLAEISPTQSSVTLRNPHATGEIDLGGEGGEEDGVFDMNLDQFMRGFSMVKTGVVEEA